jgi:hypothetical protein
MEQQRDMKERHYKVMADWLERLGLIAVASLVVQRVVSGASLSDPVVILGVVLSIMFYAFAYHILLKS